MKYIFLISILFPLSAIAQSPFVAIKFRCEEIMFHGDTCQSFYYVSVNQYKPKFTANQTDIFSCDTSEIRWDKVDFTNLAEEFEKTNLFTDSLQGYIIKYVYTRQDYVFENIFEFTITRSKCGQIEQMRFYFPVKISSFVTDIKLSPTYFITGDFNLTDDIEYKADTESKILFLYFKDNYWINR